MTKYKWKYKIKNACIEANTYQPCFESVMDILAEMMEIRDNAYAEWKKGGKKASVANKNQGGYDYEAKNPSLAIVNEYNKTVMTYWRELGLTPKGLNAINSEADASGRGYDPVMDVLSEFEKDGEDQKRG